MTELVRSQINVFCVMCMCGIGAGLMMGAAKALIRARRPGKVRTLIINLLVYPGIGFFISEALYFCDNGKVTFLGIGAVLCGLWLWKVLFCDILTPIGGKYVEEKG